MSNASDPHNLRRFLEAQRGVFAAALAEIRSGRKHGHWMWFIFPQPTGLGVSDMARRYAIASLAEAIAYGGHPILGPRLRSAAETVAGLSGVAVADVFGHPDELKLRSSLTLFEIADPRADSFARALDRGFNGVRDPLTLRWVAGDSPTPGGDR